MRRHLRTNLSACLLREERRKLRGVDARGLPCVQRCERSGFSAIECSRWPMFGKALCEGMERHRTVRRF